MAYGQNAPSCDPLNHGPIWLIDLVAGLVTLNPHICADFLSCF